MPQGDPAGYLPSVKKARKRKLVGTVTQAGKGLGSAVPRKVPGPVKNPMMPRAGAVGGPYKIRRSRSS